MVPKNCIKGAQVSTSTHTALKGLWHILQHATTFFSHEYYTKESKLLLGGQLLKDLLYASARSVDCKSRYVMWV